MTFEDMLQAKHDAERKQRDAFQRAHPHYTPPEHAPLEAWARWSNANLDKHGRRGFEERFPEQARMLAEGTTSSDGHPVWTVCAAWRELVYR